jgi:trans-aconitate methyltransferase
MKPESSDAKNFWGTTDFQAKTYGEAPPFYIRTLVRVVKYIQPGSVLEFGCNAGRNLELLRSVLPQDVVIRGFDVNRQSVEYGKQNWKLDLETSDESFFKKQPDNSVDVVFTVSVLDHLPEIDDCLDEILRVMAVAFVMIEPYPDSSSNYLSSFKQEGILPESITTDTPYSYTHDYYRLMPRHGYVDVLDIPLPPYKVNLGPLYRLSIFAKEQPSKEQRIKWRELRDGIVLDAMLNKLTTG